MLDRAGVAHAGAGRTAARAASAAVLEVAGRGRVLVFSFASTTSGVARIWGATSRRPGINLLADLSGATVQRVTRPLQRLTQPGDVAIASVHLGANWGYGVPEEHVRFARRLVAAGFDIVHGHSSHHVRPFEVYPDRLILYGCGDLLNDYEGIAGHEALRGDLTLIYLVDVEAGHGRLVPARLAPMRIERFRLRRASDADGRWLSQLLERLGGPFGTGVQGRADDTFTVRWPSRPRWVA
jgi:poly-gamma-glutamate synthesis protein (capsule biosynthesis protein)